MEGFQEEYEHDIMEMFHNQPPPIREIVISDAPGDSKVHAQTENQVVEFQERQDLRQIKEGGAKEEGG